MTPKSENIDIIHKKFTEKVITRKYELEKIIPPMIMEIIHDRIKEFAKENKLQNYTVTIGEITETYNILLQMDSSVILKRDTLMSAEGRFIELFLFERYSLDAETVYAKCRLGLVLHKRKIVQFFLYWYSKMSLSAIGAVTGKMNHATILHSRNEILKEILKDARFRKEMFICDRTITNTLNIPSRLFEYNGEILEEALIKCKLMSAVV